MAEANIRRTVLENWITRPSVILLMGAAGDGLYASCVGPARLAAFEKGREVKIFFRSPSANYEYKPGDLLAFLETTTPTRELVEKALDDGCSLIVHGGIDLAEVKLPLSTFEWTWIAGRLRNANLLDETSHVPPMPTQDVIYGRNNDLLGTTRALSPHEAQEHGATFAREFLEHTR